MKRVIFVWFMIAFVVSVSAQYYYSYNNPIRLNKTDTAVILSGNPEVEDYLTNNPSLVVSRNNKYTIISDQNMFPKETVKTYPVYKTEDGCLLGCNGQILFSPNKEDNINSILHSFPIEILKITKSYVLAKISVNSNEDDLTIANAIQESGLVHYSHPNFVVNFQKLQDTISDPYFPNQFYLHSIGQIINDGHETTVDADINAPEAWSITKGSTSIVIAVIDEGVTDNHPDLPSSRQLRLPNSNLSALYDGSSINDPSPFEDDNHGNACAGIIAASHNNEGIAGIAPNCVIMPIRVTFGYSSLDDFVSALNFAIINGADIISNSWSVLTSEPNYFPAIVSEINNATYNGRNGKGCVVSFAAGNTAHRVYNGTGYVTFPANCSNELMITVGASDRNNEVANYSPSGDKISVVAPSHKAYQDQISGEDFEIWTLDTPDSAGYNPNKETGEVLPSFGINYLSYTGRFGGTSAACPQVSGTAALMLSINPNLSAYEIKKIIEKTAKKIGFTPYQMYGNHPNGTWNSNMGYGLLNAHKAVLSAAYYQIYGEKRLPLCDNISYTVINQYNQFVTDVAFEWTCSDNIRIISGKLTSSVIVKGVGFGEGWLSCQVIHMGDTISSCKNVYIAENNEAYYIDSTLISTLSFPSTFTIGGTVDIGAGTTITWTDKTVHIAKDARLVVRPGGKLIVNGGTLTSACPGELWQGIEVVGDRTKRQLAQYQGTVELKNGAVIENAHCGIHTGLQGDAAYSTAGGIIKADSAFFVNNRRAVAFISYQNTHPNGSIADNVSYFNNCEFTVDNNNLFAQNNCGFIDHVTMWKVRGVDFTGCRFTNATTAIGDRHHAIYTEDAGFEVNTYCRAQYYTGCECPENSSVYSEFSGFTTAIEVNTTGEQHPVLVNRANFSNNGTGIKINGNNFATVTRCDFDLQSAPVNVQSKSGLFLNSCTGYLVEGNSFHKMSVPSVLESIVTKGIVVTNTGNPDNQLHLNDFIRLSYGIHASGNNRALQMSCNSFLNNLYGIFSSSDWGVSLVQGSSTEGADNDFKINVSSDFYNAGATSVIYYYSTGGFHAPTLCYGVSPQQAKNANPCDSTLCNGGGTPRTLAEFQSDVDAASYYDAVRTLMADTVLDLNMLEQWHTAAQPIADPYSLAETRFMEGYAETFAENAEDAETANYADFHALKLALRDVNDGTVGANDYSPLQTDGFINWYALTPAQIAQLQTIAERNTGRASVMARGVLCFFHGICYEDDLLGDDNMDNHDNNMETRSAKVSQQDGETNLTVYPNPTDDVLFVELRGGAGIATVALYDLQGRLVETAPTARLHDAETAAINVKTIPAGMYVLRVTDADGKEYHQKIVRK